MGLAGLAPDLDQHCHPGWAYTSAMDKDAPAKTAATEPITTDDGISVFGDSLRDILLRAHVRHRDLVQELDRLGVQVDPVTGVVTFRPAE